MGLIELRGPEFVLKATFDNCCDAQTPSPSAKRSLTLLFLTDLDLMFVQIPEWRKDM